MRQGNYMVYKVINREGNEEMLFFLPENEDKTLFRKLKRLRDLSNYRDSGYEVFAVLYCDKETYLNLRLDEIVKDYCQNDIYERETKSRRYEMERDVYEKTMMMIEDYKWTCLKRLYMAVKRLIREDYDIHSEIALALYDDYCRTIGL